MLASIDLQREAAALRTDGRPNSPCRSLKEAKEVAQALIDNTAKPHLVMNLLFTTLGVPRDLQYQILERWNISGYPRIRKYAPYVAHVITVEVFFQLALAASLISSERVTNRVDISYLHYLPFCTVFASSDRLHQRCAPLFLRSDQEFVWGPDLKADLGRINNHYLELPEATRDSGVMAFANSPPIAVAPLVASIWDKATPGWRDKLERPAPPASPELTKRLVEEVKGFEQGEHVEKDSALDSEDISSMTIKRQYHRRKGSWYQMPKDLKLEQEE